MITRKKIFYIILLAVVLILLYSCSQKALPVLKRETLFNLNIGKIDNEIDLFQVKGRAFTTKNRIFMKNGIFYIANGNSGKVMEFSSYGDLIFMLYNPLMNTKPVLLDSDISGKTKTTRRAVKYNFYKIGEIVVDNNNSLWIEDAVPEGKYVKDKKLGIILTKVVRHFNRNGELINYIGQEGIGGTPFPFIENLYITSQNEPVVISRTPADWEIFWFYSSGELRYHIRIDENHLPNLTSSDNEKAEIEKIVTDYNNPVLYVVVSYFKDIIDPSTNARSGINKAGSFIYSLNLKTGKYTKVMDIPDKEQIQEVLGTREIKIPGPSYELLGITEDKFVFLMRNNGVNKYRLLIKRMGGTANASSNNAGASTSRVSEDRPAIVKNITIEDTALHFKYITLDPSGILYGMLADDSKAHIVWWRSDKLLKEEKKAAYE